jgi:hypothetical protein
MDASGPAVALSAGEGGSRQIVEFEVKPLSFGSADAWVGVVARYVDSNNHYTVALRSDDVVELRKTENGLVTTIASATAIVTAGSSQTLRLTTVGESLKVYLNGRLALQATDTTFSAGSTGLATFGASAEFDEWLVIAP